MYKNLLISVLSTLVLLQSGFITPSNTAAVVLAPVAWYFAIMFTLVWIDYMKVEKRKKARGAATPNRAHEEYHSFIVNGKEE